jgi:hypothetical protein
MEELSENAQAGIRHVRGRKPRARANSVALIRVLGGVL